MFYLQSKGKAGEAARLDSASGALEIVSVAQVPEAKSAPKFGSYDYVDRHVVGLFRQDGALWLRVDDVPVRIDDDVRARWELKRPPAGERRAVFQLERAGEIVLSLEYRPFGNRKLIPGDMTPFVDEEEYDFMIFVLSVLDNSERRAAIYQKPFVL